MFISLGKKKISDKINREKSRRAVPYLKECIISLVILLIILCIFFFCYIYNRKYVVIMEERSIEENNSIEVTGKTIAENMYEDHEDPRLVAITAICSKFNIIGYGRYAIKLTDIEELNRDFNGNEEEFVLSRLGKMSIPSKREQVLYYIFGANNLANKSQAADYLARRFPLLSLE